MISNLPISGAATSSKIAAVNVSGDVLQNLTWWRQTFKRNGCAYKGGEIHVMLAGTDAAARVFDTSKTVHTVSPQVYADGTGFVRFAVDPKDYPTGQLFDVTCYSGSCLTDDPVELKSLMILQDTEGGRSFKQMFVQSNYPDIEDENVKVGDVWVWVDNNNEWHTAELVDGEISWVSRRDGTITTASQTANWSQITDDDGNKPFDNADVTADQFDQDVGDIDAGIVNFNARNDRLGIAVDDPVIAADGSAVDHVTNTDGGVDISFEWSWSGTESEIDGFVVVVRGSKTDDTSYVIGDTVSEEQTFFCQADRRYFILKGVSADLYWTFGVYAYRTVDPDVDADGVITSSTIQPTLAAEDPYQASSSVAFDGDITGTVNGQSSSAVVYHNGTKVSMTDGSGVDASDLDESSVRKWAWESGADVTNNNTANNTDYVNGSETQTAYAHGVYGDINVYDGADINVYDGGGVSVQDGGTISLAGTTSRIQFDAGYMESISSTVLGIASNNRLDLGASTYARLMGPEVSLTSLGGTKYLSCVSSTSTATLTHNLVIDNATPTITFDETSYNNWRIRQDAGELQFYFSTVLRAKMTSAGVLQNLAEVSTEDLTITGDVTIDGNTGWNGTFTNGDSDTVTVTDGIITDVS